MQSTAMTAPRIVLGAATAADLMTANPVSIRADAGVAEAVEFLTARGINAAPVIDVTGRPVGVLSRTDIVIHERETPDEPGVRAPAALVRDLMSPAVFSVAPETAAGRVVDDLINLGIHQLFVVDRGGVLVGVISALDVLRALRPESR